MLVRDTGLSVRIAVRFARTVVTAEAARAAPAVPAWAMVGATASNWSSASKVSISGRGRLFCGELLSCRGILWLNREVSVEKSSDNHESDSQRSEREEDRLSLFTFVFMVTNLTPAIANPFGKSVRLGTVSWYEVVRIWGSGCDSFFDELGPQQLDT